MGNACAGRVLRRRRRPSTPAQGQHIPARRPKQPSSNRVTPDKHVNDWLYTRLQSARPACGRRRGQRPTLSCRRPLAPRRGLQSPPCRRSAPPASPRCRGTPARRGAGAKRARVGTRARASSLRTRQAAVTRNAPGRVSMTQPRFNGPPRSARARRLDRRTLTGRRTPAAKQIRKHEPKPGRRRRSPPAPASASGQSRASGLQGLHTGPKRVEEGRIGLGVRWLRALHLEAG